MLHGEIHAGTALQRLESVDDAQSNVVYGAPPTRVSVVALRSPARMGRAISGRCGSSSAPPSKYGESAASQAPCYRRVGPLALDHGPEGSQCP